ncbi:MAG: precorrin-3B C(17)-methyltransferase [Candidatus Binataceae bacterium]|nr:precorrin-3B C(17)-methyltransferase [Candidatus Binataceae bacterium]
MARVGRLAGAILAETGGEFYLVGNTKEPCDFEAAGFESPGEIDALKKRYIKLAPLGAIELGAPYLKLEVEGEALAALLAERLLIERNASVSDRLWRLLMDPSGQDEDPAGEAVDARWLGEIPAPLWGIVRDTVLRCL